MIKSIIEVDFSFSAVKAVTAAQLSMASHGVYSVTLDEAIEAMRLTAADMSVKYRETSLSGLAVSVNEWTVTWWYADGFVQDDCEDTFDCACLLRTLMIDRQNDNHRALL